MSLLRDRPMWRLLAALSIVVVTTPLGAAVAAEATVTISTTLQPSDLTVAPGTTVHWVNQDGTEHRVRSDDGPQRFDSGNLVPGGSFSFTFTVEGAYPYVDDRDRDNPAYHGIITVSADAPPGPDEPPPPPPAAGDVTIVNRSFQPSSITVAAGGTVTWANNDGDQHTVTATDSSWGSGVFGSGTYSRAFPTPGTFPYLCLIHPDMTGTVTVTGAGGGTPPPPVPPPATPPPPAPAPSPGSVNIVDFAFDPVSLTVDAGTTVTWANRGASPHTVTASGGSFDSGLLGAGDTYSRTFPTAGTYAYLCTLHPEMTATILVNGSDGTPPPPEEPAPPSGSALPSAAGPTPSPTAGGIAIIDNAFSPKTKTIRTGTTLVWTNTGAIPHTVTGTDGDFDSGVLLRGATYRRTFTQPGTFGFLCTIHPAMTGTITVTGQPAGPSPAAEVSAAGTQPGAPPPVPPGDSEVTIFDNGFRPASLTVAAGQRVSWTNTGAIPHTVTARDGSFDSEVLTGGSGYARRFATPGSYPYFCTIHPEMTGTITVTDAVVPGDESATEEVFAAVPPEPADAGGDAARPPPAAVVSVNIIDLDFSPRTVTIETGETVRWTNVGVAPHTVTARHGAFDSGLLEPGASFEQAYAEAGTFEYFCTLHPDMVGVVEVVPPTVVAAGVGGSDPPLAVALILGGAMVAAMSAFAFGMARFARMAARDEARLVPPNSG